MEQEYADPLLIEKIRRGENQAFKVVMDMLKDRLAVMAYALLSHHQNAEDAVAHGFFKLFQHREKMESMQHVEGFLHDTVQHKCLEGRRKDRRRKELWALRPAWMARSEAAEKGGEADQKVLKSELVYCIQSALDRMPAQWREAYQLYIVEDRKAREVADRMGISEQTVRQYAHRAAGEIYGEAVSKGLHILLILWILKMLF
ncbi:RNA polymerase sigma factor [Flavitalea sp. BT771]|uniref:RNA polymerase sigma factor n=1 Tax=Flavitalea sp. BT771 TaxID=3063329 RepID=UPI0026E1A926|nr:RNA polymerase sigma factor [Flavitalea sp. BT771]MDO6433024.1 RNA polymerase sigma factor [Flavitalea sp. BT771]MDV6221700.1 RNA polymerase sigma factor [Flavitalea sp. BT771]